MSDDFYGTRDLIAAADRAFDRDQLREPRTPHRTYRNATEQREHSAELLAIRFGGR